MSKEKTTPSFSSESENPQPASSKKPRTRRSKAPSPDGALTNPSSSSASAAKGSESKTEKVSRAPASMKANGAQKVSKDVSKGKVSTKGSETKTEKVSRQEKGSSALYVKRKTLYAEFTTADEQTPESMSADVKTDERAPTTQGQTEQVVTSPSKLTSYVMLRSSFTF